jgi:Uncharacterized protein conserved in bacteria
MNQVFQVTTLRYNAADNSVIYLVVTIVHLKAGPLNRWTRKRQTSQVAEILAYKKDQYLKIPGMKEDNIGIIVCGDFNEVPNTSPIQQLTENKSLNLNSLFDDAKYTVYHIFGLIMGITLPFGITLPYKDVVDFVLYSPNLFPTKKVLPPTDEEVGPNGLLSGHYPSDHLSLYCEFSFAN